MAVQEAEASADLKFLTYQFVVLLMNGDQTNGIGSDKTRKSAMNGKTKGFGNFFKRGSAKKAEKPSTIQGRLHHIVCIRRLEQDRI